jgi:hypothetical protein
MLTNTCGCMCGGEGDGGRADMAPIACDNISKNDLAETTVRNSRGWSKCLPIAA